MNRTISLNGANIGKRWTGALSEKDTRSLPAELYRNIVGLSEGRPLDGLAREMDTETRSGLKGTPLDSGGGLCVPLGYCCRALETITYNSGGSFVGAEPITIDKALRPASVCVAAGAMVMEGLTGNLAIARETGQTTLSWLSSGVALTESDGTYGTLNLSPNRLSGATRISRQLDIQTGGLLARFLLDSLAIGVGVAIDKGALNGSGVAGEVAGLYTTAGVNTVTFGAAASLAKVVDYETQITTANGADANISFVATPAVRAKWKALQRWTNASVALWTDDEKVFGKPAYVTTNMPTNGICAGDFSKMVVAFWGEGTPVQLTVNPYTNALLGQISINVDCLADVGPLRPTCFVINADSAVQ